MVEYMLSYLVSYGRPPWTSPFPHESFSEPALPDLYTTMPVSGLYVIFYSEKGPKALQIKRALEHRCCHAALVWYANTEP